MKSTINIIPIEISREGKWYTFLLSLYFIISSLGDTNTHDMGDINDNMLPKLAAGVFISYNIFLWIKYSSIPYTKMLRSFSLFTIITLLSFIYYYIFVFSGLFYISMYLKVIMWLLALVVLFKHFSVNSKEEMTWMSKCFCIIFLLGGVITYASQIIKFGEVDYGSGSCLYVILPLIFLVFRDSRWLLYMLLSVFVISAASLMRKPILITFLVILFMYKEVLGKVKISTTIVIVLLFFIVLSGYIENIFDTIMERMKEEEEEGRYGSGRSEFWVLILNNFYYDKNIFLQLWGSGMGSVQQFMNTKYGMPIGAHNGFIDCLYNYGIVGICSYISIFIQMNNCRSKIRELSTYLSKILTITLLMWFVQNLIYFGYEGPYMISYSFIFAYIFSSYEKGDSHESNITEQ